MVKKVGAVRFGGNDQREENRRAQKKPAMRSQKAITANPDSDQSISDDEELGHDWPGNCVSLATSAEKKEGSEILSRLELLKGAHEIGAKTNNSSRMQTSTVFEDDVEMPEFYDEGDSICVPTGEIVEDEISTPNRAKKFSKDAMLGFGAEKQDNSYSWSSMSKEAKALINLNEQASSHSKPNKSSRGIKGKAKPKLSFRFQSHREGPSSPSTSKYETKLAINEVPEILDAIESRTELPEDIQDEENDFLVTTPREEALRHERSEQSMSALLDGLQDTSSLLGEISRKNSSKRGKKLQLVVKRNIIPLGDRTANDEVSPDLMDSNEPSSDSETSDKDVVLGIPDMKRQSIVDQFQEAFGATFSSDNKTSLHSAPRSGLLWRLQQVMQTEKEQEEKFSEKLVNGAHQNEPGCIYAKVLSRHLEGKLTVCRCFVSKSFESLPQSELRKGLENEGSEKTIIFNKRVSINVDLEVGNYVRIHPPWKEVQGGHDKSCILTTCFSYFHPTNSGLPLDV